MTYPRTLDVPELSSIGPAQTLADWRKSQRPAITTRRIALAYLPTAGLWSAVRAVKFCRKDWSA